MAFDPDADPHRVGRRAPLVSEPRWYACRTRARAEKQVDRLLARAGVEAYLPTVELERAWADRTKRVALAVRRVTCGVRDGGDAPEAVDWMAVGTEVEVTDGPFRGMRGLLTEVRGRTRVVVRLSAIRMAAGVTVGAEMVRQVA